MPPPPQIRSAPDDQPGQVSSFPPRLQVAPSARQRPPRRSRNRPGAPARGGAIGASHWTSRYAPTLTDPNSPDRPLTNPSRGHQPLLATQSHPTRLQPRSAAPASPPPHRLQTAPFHAKRALRPRVAPCATCGSGDPSTALSGCRALGEVRRREQVAQHAQAAVVGSSQPLGMAGWRRHGLADRP